MIPGTPGPDPDDYWNAYEAQSPTKHRWHDAYENPNAWSDWKTDWNTDWNKERNMKKDKSWKWNDEEWHRTWQQDAAVKAAEYPELEQQADQQEDEETEEKKDTEDKKDTEKEATEGDKDKEPEKKKKWEPADIPEMKSSQTVWIGYFLPDIQEVHLMNFLRP